MSNIQIYFLSPRILRKSQHKEYEHILPVDPTEIGYLLSSFKQFIIGY